MQILKCVYSHFALDYLRRNNMTFNTNILDILSRTSVVTCTLKCVQSESCFAMNMKCREEEEDCDCDLLGNFAVSDEDLTETTAEYSYIGPG